MSYLSDYLHWNSGNECPENFHIFASLTLISAVVNRKVYIDWPPNRIHTNLYTFLVGDQGSRKGVAKSAFYNLLVEHFTHIPRGASTTTPQAITKRLASDECTVGFIDPNGMTEEVHTMVFSIGELKHFLGINQAGMLDLFTDAWDEKYLEADYKSTGTDVIKNPYIVMLACETPDWILARLKTELISGGFCRRVLWIHEKVKRTAIAKPFVSPEMIASRDRCIERLKKAMAKIGQVTFSPEADEYYCAWYYKHESTPPADPLMKGFHTSHHELALKIATLLTLVDSDKMVLELETLKVALALLDRIIPGMHDLFRGAGRNVLAQPTERMLDWLLAKGGESTEKELLQFMSRDMDPRECYAVMQHLQKTEQIVVGDKEITLKEPNGTERKIRKRVVMTKEKYERTNKAS